MASEWNQLPRAWARCCQLPPCQPPRTTVCKQQKQPSPGTYQFCYNECIIHQVQEGSLCVNVVKGVGSFEALVDWVVHHCRGQRVEAQEVCQGTSGALPQKTSRGLSERSSCSAAGQAGRAAPQLCTPEAFWCKRQPWPWSEGPELLPRMHPHIPAKLKPSMAPQKGQHAAFSHLLHQECSDNQLPEHLRLLPKPSLLQAELAQHTPQPAGKVFSNSPSLQSELT